MKIAVLGDTHFGARNGSPLFSKFFEKFYEFFIQYLLDNDIKNVFQLGDLFDTRKFTNHLSLAHAKRYFFDPLDRHGIKLGTIVGNHDIFYRESVSINSSSLVLGEYEHVFVHDKPSVVTLDGTDFHIIPWICKENEADVFNELRKTKADICLGHFEISGFSMYKGVASHGGLDRSIFDRYEQVWSGHYHTRSQNGNITYVGTPYELTWQDAGDPRGFHVFDTETRLLTFVGNPFTIHHRYEYNDSGVFDPSTVDYTQFRDKIVRVVVVNKSDVLRFDNFMGKTLTSGAHEVKVLEDVSEFKDGDVGEEIDLEDTLSLVSSYVDSVQTDHDKEEVKKYMKSLYVEAINLE
jgi:DNA repair exonuclease SbcCD nuclease subunit